MMSRMSEQDNLRVQIAPWKQDDALSANKCMALMLVDSKPVLHAMHGTAA